MGTTLIMGFSQNAKPKEALEHFDRILEAQVKTNEVTLASVISVCAQFGEANYVKWVRDVTERAGFGPSNNVVVGTN